MSMASLTNTTGAILLLLTTPPAIAAETFTPAYLEPVSVEYSKAPRSQSITYESPEAYQLNENDLKQLQSSTQELLIAPWLGEDQLKDTAKNAKYLVTVSFDNVHLNAPLNPRSVRTDSYVKNSGRMTIKLSVVENSQKRTQVAEFERKADIGIDALPGKQFTKVVFWQEMRQTLRRLNKQLENALPQSKITD